MTFHLFPILDEMEAFYGQPRSRERFQDYLSKLQGATKDMVLPIMGFNPMAKEHVLEKIRELKALQAERLMEATISEFNETLEDAGDAQITVVLNLADDLKGGWTNFYTTDFDSKFKLNALVERNFCAPYFWSSESYTEQLINDRTLAYLGRTFYWKHHPKPITLEDHLKQEVFVCQRMRNTSEKGPSGEYESIERFFEVHRHSNQHSVIFNFFYGDSASQSLEYSSFGIQGKTGFDYAEWLAMQKA